VVKLEEMQGAVNQAVIILYKESLAPIGSIKVYKSDVATEKCPDSKPAVENISSEIEAPEHPKLEGYASDTPTIRRDLKALCRLADMEATSSDEEDANKTVVEANFSDLDKTSADQTPPL